MTLRIVDSDKDIFLLMRSRGSRHAVLGTRLKVWMSIKNRIKVSEISCLALASFLCALLYFLNIIKAPIFITPHKPHQIDCPLRKQRQQILQPKQRCPIFNTQNESSLQRDQGILVPPSKKPQAFPIAFGAPRTQTSAPAIHLYHISSSPTPLI